MHHRNLAVATAIGALGLGILVVRQEPVHRRLPAYVDPPVAVSTQPGVEPDSCVRSSWARLRRMCGDVTPLAKCVQAARSTVATAACCDDVDKLIQGCS